MKKLFISAILILTFSLFISENTNAWFWSDTADDIDDDIHSINIDILDQENEIKELTIKKTTITATITTIEEEIKKGNPSRANQLISLNKELTEIQGDITDASAEKTKLQKQLTTKKGEFKEVKTKEDDAADKTADEEVEKLKQAEDKLGSLDTEAKNIKAAMAACIGKPNQAKCLEDANKQLKDIKEQQEDAKDDIIDQNKEVNDAVADMNVDINKVVTNWETLEKNRNDFKQLYYDFKDREFEIRSREDLTEVTDDINLLIDEIKDANSEDNITLIPKIIYKEALTVAEEKKVQPKIDYLFNSLGMTHKLNEELITKAETYANSAEVIACDKASGEEKKEACTKKKKTGKAIVLEEEILEEMMLEEGATPYLTAPIFDGDGLYGGANTTEMYLDNNISKERDLKMLIIGWTLFLLPIAALMAVLAIVWAGILYVTAIGDDGRIETAKKIILWVIIGILAILSAYAIVNTVMQAAF